MAQTHISVVPGLRSDIDDLNHLVTQALYMYMKTVDDTIGYIVIYK